MAIADIVISSYFKQGYHLSWLQPVKFGTNWLSFVENIPVLLHHVNLSHSLADILIFLLFSSHYCTNFNKLFLFSYKFGMLFSFFI